ncbi:hypothetical protein PF002_g4505 [Phytophthora fragariae]|uniref:Uncharacterized protein n=1 Tax=Phytophthora fragariae TaxID=53985 RepID=A0A6A3U9S5_9STRA|nr:hypothetical protein PF009_g923 [Phytophthora fragariae]KAE9014109.1 hypothetical protein PF011_g8207 [Phytophthora fragariae]KAE9130648.1 hypothetical protein PF007_g4423 [Phytophthora fragariae]KAE9148025.1 hypothetical protein PF006_g7346 [Phytophthora fragariae]KAE9238463.1 hypothetical protein PF004_g8313 [Phytophthora fragariae]
MAGCHWQRTPARSLLRMEMSRHFACRHQGCSTAAVAQAAYMYMPVLSNRLHDSGVLVSPSKSLQFANQHKN